jgi:hypothetical protein
VGGKKRKEKKRNVEGFTDGCGPYLESGIFAKARKVLVMRTGSFWSAR